MMEIQRVTPHGRRLHADAEERRHADAARRRDEAERRRRREDEIALALRLAFVAYSDPDTAERYLSETGHHGFQQLASVVGTEGFCCIRDNHGYLSFRGTSSLLDVAIDCVAMPWFRPPVHLGFGLAWHSVAVQVVEWLGRHPTLETLSLVGHSLGGGIAHVAALELAPAHPIARVITFGAPRAMFWTTHVSYDLKPALGAEGRLRDVTWRVVNRLDVVSKIPWKSTGYEHVGELHYLDREGAMHRGDAARRIQQAERFTAPVYAFADRHFGDEGPVVSRRPGTGRDWRDAWHTYKDVFPLSLVRDAVYYAVLLAALAVAPLFALIAVVVYASRSATAHLKTDYSSVLAVEDVQRRLDEIRAEVGRPRPWATALWTLCCFLAAIAAIAAIGVLCYLLVVGWMVPVLTLLFDFLSQFVGM